MLFNFAELQLNNKGELYRSLYEKIKEAVECGALKKGEKLPSIREAALQLGVSRTTVENAYTRLCIEGIAESKPQSGYFIIGNKNNFKVHSIKSTVAEKRALYDFSSRSIDVNAADTELWKKTLRSVLWDSEQLTTYGERQGEIKLREALADYSYKARGVKCTAENIVIGAGVGPLLNILCGLLGRSVTVGIENGGFAEAEQIFYDYGINTYLLKSDFSGALVSEIYKSNVDLLFLLPSALSKISVSALNNRRNEYIKWSNEKENRFIVEDDYNGELRYTARTVTSLQGKAPQNTIYIGSFSKLLLPSVRIAYMVLPDSLIDKLNRRKTGYNQTCGKIEQLALAEYILNGSLEKHLRRLRRIYYNKSQVLCRELLNNGFNNTRLYESSLTLELVTDLDLTSSEICALAENGGIRLMKAKEKGAVRLCFAGIDEAKIPEAVAKLSEILKK